MEARFQLWITFAIKCVFLLLCSVNESLAGSELVVGVGAQPHLSLSPAGEAVLSWVEPLDDGDSALKYVVREDGAWSESRTVVIGDNWFINWADFPSVTPISDFFWGAHWLAKKDGGPYAYDVMAAFSTDGGESWGAPFVVHNDETATEHGFVTLFPWQDNLSAIWLDGRMTASGEEPHSHSGGMTLRSATFDEAGQALSRTEVDDLVCDCCGTDVAITDSGPVAVYRNRTADEIRDIYITRFIDQAWEPGKSIAVDQWRIAGCPVNGPAIAANGNDVAIAWFSAADNQPVVRMARSSDGGVSFDSPVDLDRDAPVGRVDIEILKNGDVIVSWLASGNENAELVAQRIGLDGIAQDRFSVARTGLGRASGFPQMIVSGGELVFAWTEWKESRSRVISRAFALEDVLKRRRR